MTDNGRVENRLFNVPEGFTASDIEKMVNILNERLIGTPLVHLQKILAQETKTVLERHIHHAGDLYRFIPTGDFNRTGRTAVFWRENEYDESTRIQ